MAAKQLTKMSDDQFMSEWDKANAALTEAKAKCRAFSEEAQKRATEASVRAKLEFMSDAERMKMAQLMQTEGIFSEEKVSEA